MVFPGYLTRWISAVRFSTFFLFLPLSVSRLSTLFSWDRKRNGCWCFARFLLRSHCGANYFATNYLGASANYCNCDEYTWIYSPMWERIYSAAGKNGRRNARYTNWCTCIILPSSVLLLMRAVLQFRGASSAVIFILPSVIRGEATKRCSKKYLERRYGGTEYFKGGIRTKCAYANDFSAMGRPPSQSLLRGFFSNLKARTFANR